VRGYEADDNAAVWAPYARSDVDAIAKMEGIVVKEEVLA